jgi:CheY-like chemotaxis protein
MYSQPSVLYIEDNPQSRTVMRVLLRGRMGLSNVTIFEDSTDFRARVEALDPVPDLILLDIHMEPYDGFEMLRVLRQLGKFDQIPIVALTASVMHEEVQLLKTAGFSSCLAKPIDLSSFPDIIHRILDGEAIWRIVE